MGRKTQTNTNTSYRKQYWKVEVVQVNTLIHVRASELGNIYMYPILLKKIIMIDRRCKNLNNKHRNICAFSFLHQHSMKYEYNHFFICRIGAFYRLLFVSVKALNLFDLLKLCFIQLQRMCRLRYLQPVRRNNQQFNFDYNRSFVGQRNLFILYNWFSLCHKITGIKMYQFTCSSVK